MSAENAGSSTSGTGPHVATSTVSIFGGNATRSDSTPAGAAHIPSPSAKTQSALNLPVLGRKPEPSSDFGKQAARKAESVFHPLNLITLLVGPGEHEMVVHKSFLCRHSGFFKACLKRQWAEGKARLIRLPEEWPYLVQHYIEHLYGCPPPTHDQQSGAKYFEGDHQYEVLVGLYLFAERAMHVDYQNTIIQEVIRISTLEYGPEKTKYYTATRSINMIYEGTTPNSPFRRLVVDFAVVCSSNTWFNDLLDPRYLLDFSKLCTA
jgi:hypothetical protein